MSEVRTQNENSVIFRTIIISAVVLSGIFIAFFFLEDNLAKIFGKYAGHVTTGLMLLCLWLVASSAVRSIHNLEKRASTWKLVLGGVLTGAFGAAFYTAFLMAYPRVAKAENTLEVAGVTGGMIMLFSTLALVISLITVVNIRVRNRFLGNVLEFLIIGGSILAFVYIVSK